MREIEFTIDERTGEMDMQINGVPGPACGEIADKVKEVLGAPAVERNTAGYHAKAQVKPQAQTRGRN